MRKMKEGPNTFRELTEYEKKKWFDDYGRFNMHENAFLGYGDELGEAFLGALYCTNKADYGLDDWFVLAAQVQVLDMYYDQIHLYTGEYGGPDYPEDYGLPSLGTFIHEYRKRGIESLPSLYRFDGSLPKYTDKQRELWDWAMDQTDRIKHD
jgi:hypothetical protein